MENELNAARVTVGLHSIAAILVGYASVLLASRWYAAGLGIAVLFGAGYISERLVAKRGVKFWMANGVIIYLFIWLITWTFFINL